MKYYICSDPNFLAHHGVKGMKWGVRRYQNYDGTRIGGKKKNNSFSKETKKINYDYSAYGGEKGSYEVTKYSNKNSSGRKAFDSEIDKEISSTTDFIRKNYDPEYIANVNDILGGDFNKKLEDEGIEFIYQVIDNGQEHAEKWLQENSSLKDYDYEISVSDEGEGYVHATLRVFGDKYDFSVGVEEGYSDDAGFVDKEAATRRKEKLAKVEKSKAYRSITKRMKQIEKEMYKIEDATPKGQSRFDNDHYNMLEDEWYELSDKQNKMMKDALGRDY